MGKKGISLIVLVITIIVMIIIAGAIIVSLSDVNLIDMAQKSIVKHNFSVFKEEYEQYLINEKVKAGASNTEIIIDADKNGVTQNEEAKDLTIFNIIPSLEGSKFEDDLVIENGKLVFYGEDEEIRESVKSIVELGVMVRLLSEEELVAKSAIATAPASQLTTDTSVVGIDSWGKSVNLDLWTFSLSGTTGSIKYKGVMENGKIVGEVPAYIKSAGVSYKITSMKEAFMNKTSLIEAPYIPATVTKIYNCFYGCSKLETPPVVPISITNMQGAFWGCTKLTGKVITIHAVQGTISAYAFKYVNGAILEGDDEILLNELAATGSSVYVNYRKLTATDNDGESVDLNKWIISLSSGGTATAVYGRGNITNGAIEGTIPKTITGQGQTYTVTSLKNAFNGKTTLVTAPEIPNTVTNMYNCFYDCSKLEIPPVVPNSVTNMQGAFWKCYKLTGKTITVNAPNNVVAAYAFKDVNGAILQGPNETALKNLAASGISMTYVVTGE